MSYAQYASMLSSVKRLLKTVGAYQKKLFRSEKPGGGGEKSAREFVSCVDIESESRIRDGLYRIFREASFFGEETEQTLGERYTWIVDPIDGTVNYLSGFDVWSISVALFEGRKPILGIVYKPYTGEFFHAIRGKGAFHGKTPLPMVEKIPLKDSLLATAFPYRSRDTADDFFRSAQDILYRCRGIRRIGSAALDLSYVAAGYFQGYWEVDLKPYDVAAALLMLEETGCTATTFSGKPYDPFSCRTLVAGCPGVHETLQGILFKHYAAKD